MLLEKILKNPLDPLGLFTKEESAKEATHHHHHHHHHCGGCNRQQNHQYLQAMMASQRAQGFAEGAQFGAAAMLCAAFTYSALR